MRNLYAILAAISLLACTAIPFAYFWNAVTVERYKTILFIASIAWFVFATLWSTWRKDLEKR